jgi:ABC-type Fe3+-siderophore transport system permease subunit
VIVSRFGPPLKLKANSMKRQKAFSLALLLIEVTFTLFIAGIVVPSLLRSELATKEALAVGSLRAINIAGFAFSYTTQSVEFATLGSLMGTFAAFVIHFRAAARRNTTSIIRTILQGALLRH